MKWLLLFFATITLSSCWKFDKDYDTVPPPQQPYQKVWGSKPVYSAEATAKQVQFDPQKHPLHRPGNIYAFGNYIFQVDVGRGIHVIDNTISANAERIGFITVNGCEQLSIRGSYLYVNSLDDLVTIDISNTTSIREVNRVKNAFPEFMYNYPLVQPEESGYYTCPQFDSVVVGWVKDSVYAYCYKN